MKGFGVWGSGVWGWRIGQHRIAGCRILCDGRWIWIDKFEKFEPGVGAVAIKNVSWPRSICTIMCRGFVHAGVIDD